MVSVAHKFAAWGVQADFAAVSSHPAATRFSSSWFLSARRSWAIVIDTVVVLTQHGQIRRLRMPAVFVSVDVVNLASIGWYVAVWPRADQVFRHGQGAQLVGCEAGFVEIHRPGGGVEETDVEFVAKGAFHRGVDEFGAGHGRAVG